MIKLMLFVHCPQYYWPLILLIRCELLFKDEVSREDCTSPVARLYVRSVLFTGVGIISTVNTPLLENNDCSIIILRPELLCHAWISDNGHMLVTSSLILAVLVFICQSALIRLKATLASMEIQQKRKDLFQTKVAVVSVQLNPAPTSLNRLSDVGIIILVTSLLVATFTFWA